MNTYTEDEARQKWCPFAITFGRLQHYRDSEPVGTSYGPQNRGYQMGGALENCRCIASDCMVWQWAEMSHETVFPRNEDAIATLQAEGYEFTGKGTEMRRPTPNRRGSCGLVQS